MCHESEKNLPPELASLEAKLAALTPSAGRLDRDRLMYELGKAQAVPSRKPTHASWKWTLGLTLTSNVAVVLVMFLLLQPIGNKNPSQATGLIRPATGVTTPSPSQEEIPRKFESITNEETIDEPKNQLEVPTPNTNEGWGRTIASWFGMPTYEPVNRVPSGRLHQNWEDEFLLQTPYARLMANRTEPSHPSITIEQEKPASPPPLNRAELMQQYLDGEWN